MRLPSIATALLLLPTLCHSLLSALPLLPTIPVGHELHSHLSRQQDWFAQPIDHDDPALGTFLQRYWWNVSSWGGPGYPVILFTPGEDNAERFLGYLTKGAITGYLATVLNAAVLIIEHRNYGASLPYATQTTANLQQHTLHNAIHDLDHFARTVHPPFLNTHPIDNRTTTTTTTLPFNAPHAPWILIGGSYSGALTAWAQVLLANSTHTGTNSSSSALAFWAYYASSAPVQAVRDFWAYFEPIRQGLSHGCSQSLERAVQRIDAVLDAGRGDEVAGMKAAFGLGGLEDDDFVAALAYQLSMWQNDHSGEDDAPLAAMCDAISASVGGGDAPNTNNLTADARAELEVQAYARFFRDKFLSGACSQYGYWRSDPHSIACFDTHNASSPMFTDQTSVNSFHRPWVWMTCNEPLFYWQTGAPEGTPTIVSRRLSADYFDRQCELFFPPEGNATTTFGAAQGRTVAEVNRLTQGWNLTSTQRLIWSNGEFDPWRSAGVSSPLRPGGPLASTPAAPVFLHEGARHCEDLAMRFVEADAGLVRNVEDATVVLEGWVAEFYQERGRSVSGGVPW